MNEDFSLIDFSVSDVLSGYSGVSGSGIVCGNDYEIVVISDPAELLFSFVPVSSAALCLMIIAAYFYSRFLSAVKNIFAAIIRRRNYK